MDGLILIHKPPHVTSHDVVFCVRKILQEKRVGHFGTLDPLATGLLVIAVGRATKFFPFFSKEDKFYKGKIRLGFSTDTYDSLGTPVSPEKCQFPKKTEVLEKMKDFEGAILQLPPPYSAKKYKGKPLYKLARGKKPFHLTPSRVHIRSFQLTVYSPPYLDFEVECSSGTYIRSLAYDLGEKLGCGGHLAQLERTTVGPYHLKESLTLEELESLATKEEIEDFLLPLECLLSQFPKVVLDEKGAALAKNGNKISSGDILKLFDAETSSSLQPDGKETIFRLFSRDGKFLALAKRDVPTRCLLPFLVID